MYTKTLVVIPQLQMAFNFLFILFYVSSKFSIQTCVTFSHWWEKYASKRGEDLFFNEWPSVRFLHNRTRINKSYSLKGQTVNILHFKADYLCGNYSSLLL